MVQAHVVEAVQVYGNVTSAATIVLDANDFTAVTSGSDRTRGYRRVGTDILARLFHQPAAPA